MKIIRKLLWLLTYILPAILFFSYHPVISLGSDATMNFELSLPLIWLVLFDLLSLIYAIMLYVSHRHIGDNASLIENNPSRPENSTENNTKNNTQNNTGNKPSQVFRDALQAGANPKSTPQNTPKDNLRNNPLRPNNKSADNSFWGHNFPGISDRRFFLLALFPLYLTISVIWSANPLRGFLTAGIAWLIFFAVFAIIYLLPLADPPRRFRTHILFIFFLISVLVCKYCFAQSIMDLLGLSRDTTLMCAGCTYHAFGFPHPSGFAIEPQFMGNLLLAPSLTALYLVVFRIRQAGRNLTSEATSIEQTIEAKVFRHKIHLPQFNFRRWQRIGMIILAGFLSTTLFFTFSRGAIYAYAVALLVMVVIAIRMRHFRWSLITIPAVSLLLALGLQGTFAAVGPTAETFVSGITKSIHHLTLGIIDLRPISAKSQTSSAQNQTPTAAPPSLLDSDKTTSSADETATSIDETSLPGSIAYAEESVFDGYVSESTDVRLRLNQVAIWTWLSAPGREGTFSIDLDCHTSADTICDDSVVLPDNAGCAPKTVKLRTCSISTRLTPTSILFGVGLGGAGTAMHAAYPDVVTSPKEIVQNQPFSLLLETGLFGLTLAIFGLCVALFPHFFPPKFLDGRAASSSPTTATSSLPLWRHPVLPLLLPLIIAYFVTLNFFSGLPNAIQIYLMPPLLYFIFLNPTPLNRSNSTA